MNPAGPVTNVVSGASPVMWFSVVWPRAGDHRQHSHRTPTAPVQPRGFTCSAGGAVRWPSHCATSVEEVRVTSAANCVGGPCPGPIRPSRLATPPATWRWSCGLKICTRASNTPLAIWTRPATGLPALLRFRPNAGETTPLSHRQHAVGADAAAADQKVEPRSPGCPAVKSRL